MMNPGEVFEDNNGAFTVASNCRVTSRTKYFNVKYHHFWQFVKDETFKILRIKSEDQKADYLTKGLAVVLFEKNRKSSQGW